MYDGSEDPSALWQQRHIHQTGGRESAIHFKFSIGVDEFQPRLALYLGVSLIGASGVGPFVSAFVDCLLSCSAKTNSVVNGDMFVDGNLGVFELTRIKADLVDAENDLLKNYQNRQ